MTAPPAPSLEPAVHVAGLRRTYAGRTALHHLDLTVPAGSLTALIGPNGSGKTTTMRLLLGLDRPDAGTGTVLGAPLHRPARYLTKVGALIEQPALYTRLTGRTNLRVLSRLAGVDDAHISRALQLTGMDQQADRPVATYSLGMRQRLGIAAALLTEPRLLILDEPTNGLDPLGTAQLRRLLRTLTSDGVTVLISSHQLNELDATCDHFVFLHQGTTLFQGDRNALGASQRPSVEAAPEHPTQLPELADAFTEAGYRARRHEDHLLVDTAAGRAGDLNRTAAAHGITLARLAVRRPTLEEAFFSLVGQGPQSATEDAGSAGTSQGPHPC
ncbi:ATP-binding cassette domain-containing protein [Streptomyces sp. NPDC048483]|uniref:ABC transporter ATP-binding protein n=1 Tax=Streptomyces sp. NPDC048483 TaxID=3154927 RepID=UPI0034483C74